MPNDPAPLTEAERVTLLLAANGPCSAQINPETRRIFESLAARTLATEIRSYPSRFALTDAGRSALIEAAVAERFATVDKHLDGLGILFDVVPALRELARLARDQERRLVRLEQQRGGGS